MIAPVEVRISHERFTLPNGLDLIVHEDASIPMVGVNVWYHVGSKDERPGRTGFAHLFEHLMFEGSAHVPPGQFDKLLESAGGVNNGSTTTDRTNYWVNVPSNALELALWLEADRMGSLLDAMTQEKLDVQRDVVKNERRQSYENRPYGLAFEALLAHLYPAGHPYRHPVIGSMEDLSAATLDDVIAFFRTYYAPGNASVAVAGDVRTQDVLRLVEDYFADVPSGPPILEIPIEPASAFESRHVVIEDRVHLPRLYLAWHSLRHYTDADALFEVLAGVLADGKASRLHRRLVYEERIAQHVSAFQNGGELEGSFFVVVTGKPDTPLDRLREEVLEELERIAGTGVEEEERVRAVNQIESGMVRMLERVGGFGGKADRLNEYHVFAGDAGFVGEDLERYRRAVPEQLARAAGRLLEAPRVTLSVVPRGRVDLGARAPA